MALAVNDIIQVTDVQSYLGQQMLNVYHYRVDVIEALTDLNDIAEAFTVTILTAIDDIQSTLVTHSRLIVKNLTNGVDIHEEPISVVGTGSGESAASFVAAAFRLVRTNGTTRHGQKRIGGLPEGHINGNSVASGLVAAYNTVATTIGGHFIRSGTVDHDFDLAPVIVGRFPQGDPNEGELDLSVINPVQSAQFIRLTSQTTRREGRGS